jgi:SPP1 family predicted phage head-tail adaptor
MDDIIGRMRRRLTIMAPVETDDGAGGVVRTYEDTSTVWAAVEPVAGGFRLAAGASGQTVTHRIILRSGPELTAQHCLRDGTRTWRIRSVHAADGEGRFLVALTEEMTG